MEAYGRSRTQAKGYKSPADKIAAAAKSVLDARDSYPNSSLADLYESTSMPTELSKAHAKLDAAVMSAYGLESSATDAEILEVLFEMYAQQVLVTGN